MSMKTKLESTFGELNSEHGLLTLFMVVSVFMFIEAQQWEFNARVFPQSMATMIVIGSLLIIFEDYLPGPIHAIVTETSSAFGQTEDLEDEVGDGEEETTDDDVMPDYGRPFNPVFMLAVFITLYAVLGFFFSLFLMSPLFVAAYTWWVRLDWWAVIFLSLVGLGLAFAFASLIIVPVDRGVIVGDLLMVYGGVV